MVNKEKLISFETEIGNLFNEGKIKAPIHLYSGNEDEMIEVFKDIDIENDWVCCTWRNHYQGLLKGIPKEKLKERIDQRVDQMMSDGLLDEVKSLIPFRQMNALQTVGYREIFEFLDDKISLTEAVESIKINTRHYAKRQMTWFKKDQELQWLSPDEIGIEKVISIYSSGS